MNARQITILFTNVSQIINLMRTVNINKEAVATHSSTFKTIGLILEKWREQYQNPEYMKTLSLVEQQTLGVNAQNFYKVYMELQKELEYLDLSKQPTFLASAANELDKAYLLLEYLLNEIVGKTGETILPHLTSLRAKTFDGGKYKNQIDSLYSEVEAQAHDFYIDHVIDTDQPMFIPICDHLTLSACYLQKEKERLLTEALPEIKKIDIPKIEEPVIPEGPVEEHKAKMEVVKDLKN